MMRKSLLVVAACAVLTVVVFAASNSGQKTLTVGDFAVKISKALGSSARDPQSAVASLKQSGVRVGPDLGARLTEGEAARIMGDLGLKVSTQSADSFLSPAKADRLASVVSQAASIDSTVPADDLPTECLNAANRGDCVNCCKVIVGPITNAQGNPKDPGFICTRFCESVIPPGRVSRTEPGP